MNGPKNVQTCSLPLKCSSQKVSSPATQEVSKAGSSPLLALRLFSPWLRGHLEWKDPKAKASTSGSQRRETPRCFGSLLDLMLITGNLVTHSTQESKVHLFSMTKNEPNRRNRKVIKRSIRFGQEAIKRPDRVWDSCALPCLGTCKPSAGLWQSNHRASGKLRSLSGAQLISDWAVGIAHFCEEGPFRRRFNGEGILVSQRAVQ